MDIMEGSDDESGAAMEEEILRGMYPGEDELSVSKCGATASGEGQRILFRLHLTPSVGGQTASKGFVRLALDLTLCEGYPDTPPDISFSRVVGLSDAQLVELKGILEAECRELEGEYVCSSLAAIATDYLSDHNKPPRCAICLDDISLTSAGGNATNHSHVMTDQCFHFFHARCLSTWWMRCALSSATGMRGVSLFDISDVRGKMEELSSLHAQSEASLESNERAVRKGARRLEVMKQKRASLDRAGTLSEKEISEIAALDAMVLECEETLEVAKRERKADKQRTEKLKWRIGESKTHLENLCLGAQKIPHMAFEFCCPVCRAPVARSLLAPYLDFGDAGDRWWEKCGYGAGSSDGVTLSLGEGTFLKEKSNSGEGAELGNDLLMYIKSTQKLHEKLKRERQASSSPPSSAASSVQAAPGAENEDGNAVSLSSTVGGSASEDNRLSRIEKKSRRRRNKKKRSTSQKSKKDT